MGASGPGQLDLHELPLRNVGPGAAFIHDAWIGVGTHPEVASVNRRVVPSGERLRATARFAPGTGDYQFMLLTLDGNGLPRISVTYSDVGGSQRTMTRLRLVKNSEGWRVLGVELSSCDENWAPSPVPFITSEPPGYLRVTWSPVRTPHQGAGSVRHTGLVY